MMDEDVMDCDNLEEFTTDIPKMAGKLAALCRTELPLTHTKANVLVAREWLVKYMNQIHVRKTDQAKLLPVALRFCFVETKYEVMARKMTLSDEYQMRYAFANTRLKRSRTWLEWLLGHEVLEPTPTDL